MAFGVRFSVPDTALFREMREYVCVCKGKSGVPDWKHLAFVSSSTQVCGRKVLPPGASLVPRCCCCCCCYCYSFRLMSERVPGCLVVSFCVPALRKRHRAFGFCHYRRTRPGASATACAVRATNRCCTLTLHRRNLHRYVVPFFLYCKRLSGSDVMQICFFPCFTIRAGEFFFFFSLSLECWVQNRYSVRLLVACKPSQIGEKCVSQLI